MWRTTAAMRCWRSSASGAREGCGRIFSCAAYGAKAIPSRCCAANGKPAGRRKRCSPRPVSSGRALSGGLAARRCAAAAGTAGLAGASGLAAGARIDRLLMRLAVPGDEGDAVLAVLPCDVAHIGEFRLALDLEDQL